VLATAPNAKAIAASLPALGLEGTLLLVAGALEPIEVSAFALIPGDRRIQGWASGTGDDSTDALAFSKLHGIEPMIERFPLDEAQQALEHMASGKARFRAVIEAVPQ
jgi:D-arabinose 1-dehydrogenase-like Zn-dependent alcohol dehydrogenase